jgi:primosomal protein N' (replication factor Y)
VAKYRAKSLNADLILGSTLCSVNTYHNTKTGRYVFLKTDNKVVPLPEVKVIDLSKKENYYGPKFFGFSKELVSAIEQRILKKEISVIFINKLGFSRITKCFKCGKIVKCPKCDISLVHYRDKNLLKCHYCGHEQEPVARCRYCDGSGVKFSMTGTERLCSDLTKIFPGIEILRFDKDIIKKDADFDKVKKDLKADKYNIIVGTQLLMHLIPVINKDISKVTLLNVFNMDDLLYFPEYRNSEHTFWMLSKLKEMLSENSTVLIQSYDAEHYIYKYINKFEWKKFYDTELEYREELGYPPFVKLAVIKVYSKDENMLKTESENFVKFLKEKLADRHLNSIYGPIPSNLYKLKGNFHRNIIVKLNNEYQEVNTELLKLACAYFKGKKNIHINIDIDPDEIN